MIILEDAAQPFRLTKYAGSARMAGEARTGITAALKEKADPSDMVQETLLKAHRSFDQLRGRTEPELVTWLRQILRA